MVRVGPLCLAQRAQGNLLPAHPTLTSSAPLLLTQLTTRSPRSRDLRVSAARTCLTMPFDVFHRGGSSQTELGLAQTVATISIQSEPAPALSAAGIDPSLATLFPASICSLSLPGGVQSTAEPANATLTQPWESSQPARPNSTHKPKPTATREGHIQIEIEFAIVRSTSRRRRKIKMPPSSATFCECESRLCGA
jgi:hypothetical protein